MRVSDLLTKGPAPVTEETDARSRERVEEFPLPVAEDWDQTVARANKVAKAIDKHLDYEGKFQGIKMRPGRLCPEQRVNLASDLNAI